MWMMDVFCEGREGEIKVCDSIPGVKFFVDKLVLWDDGGGTSTEVLKLKVGRQEIALPSRATTAYAMPGYAFAEPVEVRPAMSIYITVRFLRAAKFYGTYDGRAEQSAFLKAAR